MEETKYIMSFAADNGATTFMGIYEVVSETEWAFRAINNQGELGFWKKSIAMLVDKDFKNFKKQTEVVI